jgi:hypothetical protein
VGHLDQHQNQSRNRNRKSHLSRKSQLALHAKKLALCALAVVAVVFARCFRRHGKTLFQGCQINLVDSNG